MFKVKKFYFIMASFFAVFLLWILGASAQGSGIPLLEDSHAASHQTKSQNMVKPQYKTAVEYKGTILRDLETHYYLFSTSKKGKIDVSWGPGSDGSDYIITDKTWSAMYFNGDELPAGEYMFVITSNPAESPEDPTLLAYHFILKGLKFKEAPDISLPQLRIDNPADPVTNLPGGEHAVTLRGSSDAAELTFGTFFLEEDLTETLTSPFDKTIYFTEESPIYSAYRISAVNEAGNMVNRYFEFHYEGGKSTLK